MIAASIVFTIMSYLFLYLNIKAYIRHLKNPKKDYIVSIGNYLIQAIFMAVMYTLLSLWFILKD